MIRHLCCLCSLGLLFAERQASRSTDTFRVGPPDLDQKAFAALAHAYLDKSPEEWAQIRPRKKLSPPEVKENHERLKNFVTDQVCTIDCKSIQTSLAQAQRKNRHAKVMVAVGATGVLVAGAANMLEHAADAATFADGVSGVSEVAQMGDSATNLAHIAAHAAHHGQSMTLGLAHGAAHHGHSPLQVAAHATEYTASAIHTSDGVIDVGDHLEHALAHHHGRSGLCDAAQQQLVQAREKHFGVAGNIGFGLSLVGIGLAGCVAADMFGGMGAITPTYLLAMKVGAVAVGVSKVTVEALKVNWSQQDMEAYHAALNEHCPNLEPGTVGFNSTFQIDIEPE